MTRLARFHGSLILGSLLSLGVAACGGEESSSSGSGGAGGSPTGPTTTTGTSTSSGVPGEYRVFDHRHTALDQVPASCISQLQSGNFVFHYAHRSHGAQIIEGAQSIMTTDPTYGFDSEWCEAPATTGVLPIWDGMTPATGNYVQPEQYWASQAGMDEVRGILSQNPILKYTLWAWSYEISEQTEASVQQYLEALSTLEAEFPDVTFIYMTGTAEEELNAANRAERNQQIRDYCQANGKVLYDFEDLDAWYNGEQHTILVDGVSVPLEHPEYNHPDPNGYNDTHTTQSSCENKARAFWTMVAALEGCTIP